jgi:predicted AlkP superfamily phosphohydrolase/phosphomutase
MGRRKLVLIGVDSVPVWLLRDVAKKYKMSAFNKFFDSGLVSDLESTIPPVTSVAWPSIYTGLGPGKHGVVEFFSLDKDHNKQLLYYDSAANEPFWNSLSKYGVRSLIVTPAMVIDVNKDENVDLITGFPMAPRYSSKGLEQAAKKAGFNGEEDLEGEIKAGRMSPKEGSMRYRESVARKISLVKDLMVRGDYDLIFVCFTETDRIQHYCFGEGMEKALEYNEPVLNEISKFIDWITSKLEKGSEEYEMMILSDHGAQPLKKKFLLNTWMIDEGYARLTPAAAEQVDKLLERGKREEEGGGINKNLKYQIREKLLKAGAKEAYEKMPKALKKIAAKSMDVGLVLSPNGKCVRVHDLNFDNFDMGNTKAFGAISTNPAGLIWINDQRFSENGATQKEKGQLKKEIISKLKALKTEDGKKLVERIYDGETYYQDTLKFIYPDILILLRDGYGVDTFNFSKEGLFTDIDPILNGDHTVKAMVGFYGNALKLSKLKSKKPHVYDIAPTVLKYFGLSSTDIDGESLI